MRPSKIMLSRERLRLNVERVLSFRHERCPLGVVVKANGYGIGAEDLVNELQRLDIRRFFTFDAFQTAELLPVLRDDTHIVMLRSFTTPLEGKLERSLLMDGRVEWTIHDLSELQRLEMLASSLDSPVAVHVEIDTGMNRGGCSTSELPRIMSGIDESPFLDLAGVSTHFASADSDPEFTSEQHANFLAVAGRERDPSQLHVFNSHGLLHNALSSECGSRIGIAILGFLTPEEPLADSIGNPFRSILRWESSICQIRTVKKGQTIGYGRSFRASTDMRIGVVPVGYADGYPARTRDDYRLEVEIGPPGTEPRFVPVVGRVNMDQITIDLTQVPEQCHTGMRVGVYGDDPAFPNHPTRIADGTGTIVYDLLCKLNPRIPRMWS